MPAAVVETAADARHCVQRRGKLAQGQTASQKPRRSHAHHKNQVDHIQKPAGHVHLHHTGILLHGDIHVFPAAALPLFQKKRLCVKKLHLIHGMLVGEQSFQIPHSPPGVRRFLCQNHTVPCGIVSQSHHGNPHQHNPQADPGGDGENHRHGRGQSDGFLNQEKSAHTAVIDPVFRFPGHLLEQFLGLLGLKRSVLQLCKPSGNVRSHPLLKFHAHQIHLVSPKPLHGTAQNQKHQKEHSPENQTLHPRQTLLEQFPVLFHTLQCAVHNALQHQNLQARKRRRHKKAHSRSQSMQRHIVKDCFQAEQAVFDSPHLHTSKIIRPAAGPSVPRPDSMINIMIKENPGKISELYDLTPFLSLSAFSRRCVRRFPGETLTGYFRALPWEAAPPL